jgi:hypothetical protein
MTSDTRPAPGLHVEPTASGRWVVCYEHHKQPLSDHLTASEAQGSAQRRDVRQSPLQAPVVELVELEVEVAVERGRMIIGRVLDHCSRAELAAAERLALLTARGRSRSQSW